MAVMAAEAIAPSVHRPSAGTGGWTVDDLAEVYDLVDGAYVLQGKASGDDELAVAGPVPVRVTPA
jgi:hypothetical protein